MESVVFQWGRTEEETMAVRRFIVVIGDSTYDGFVPADVEDYTEFFDDELPTMISDLDEALVGEYVAARDEFWKIHMRLQEELDRRRAAYNARKAKA